MLFVISQRKMLQNYNIVHIFVGTAVGAHVSKQTVMIEAFPSEGQE